MTGPEHYQEAERLVTPSAGHFHPDPHSVAEAQVHATLALAAAAGLSNPGATTEDNLAWLEVASEWERPA